MATRGLDLGDVGFSLTADTQGLERSRQKLIDFGNEVNKWERRTDEASQRITSAYMRQERALVSMYQKFQHMHSEMRKAGAQPEMYGNVTASIKLLTDTLTMASKAGRPMERSLLEMQRAGAATNAEFRRLSNTFSEWKKRQDEAAAGQIRYHKLVAAERRETERDTAQQQLRYHRLVAAERTQSEREAAVAQLRYHRQVAAERAELEREQLQNQRRTHQLAVAERIENEKAALHQQNLHHKVAVAERTERERDAAQAQMRYHRLVAAERRESLLEQRKQQSFSQVIQLAGIRADAQTSSLTGNAVRAFVPDNIAAGYNNALSVFQERVRTSVRSIHDLRLAQAELSKSFAATTQKVKEYIASQNAASQAESLVGRAAQRVRRINEVAVGFNAPERLVSANRNNLLDYQSAVFRGDRGSAAEALKRLNAGILQTQQAISSASDRAQKFAGAVRNMERASILAVGPLSGVGARLAVMSALLESVSAKAALTIAGITGVTVGVTALAIAGVRATMEMEKWVGMLTAASGAQSFVARDLEWLNKTADQYGQSIKTIVPSYAQFATSARLANVSLKDQRNIFESVLMAGTSLRWNTDQVGRAFLALEQMMSKGQIQAQELKLQLGQVLPGAFEIMAMAAGKSQKEFLKMMEQGEAYTKELLPKFAEKLREIYGEAAKLGAISIQSDIGRYETAMFNFAKAFDDTVKTSQAFHELLKGVNSTLGGLTTNMREVLSGFAAFAGFVTVMAAPTIVGGLMKAGTAIKTMTYAAMGLNAAMSATPIGFILRLAAAVGAAVMGYNILTRARNNDIDASKEAISQSAIEIAAWQKSAQVNADLWSQKTQMLTQHLQTQLSAYKIYAGAISELENKVRTEVTRPFFGFEVYKLKESWKALTGQETNEGLLTRWKAEQKERSDAISNTMKQLDALGKMKVKFEGAETGKIDGKAKKDVFASRLESSLDSVRALITELDTLKSKQKALTSGDPEGMKYFEALKDATNFVEKLKDPRLEGAIAAKMAPAFKAAGVQGKNLTEALTNLNFRIAQQKEKVEEANRVWEEKKRLLRELPEHYNKLSVSIGNMRDREEEARIALQYGEEGVEKYRREKSRMQERQQYWKELTSNQAMSSELVSRFWHDWNRAADEAYAAEDKLTVAKKYEEVLNMLPRHLRGVEDINRAYAQRVSVVLHSTAEEKDKIRQITELLKMQTKEIWLAADETRQSTYDMIQGWTEGLADAFTEMAETGKLSFSSLVQSMWKDIQQLHSKMMAKGLMEYLLGDYATAGTTGNSGIFGSLLSSILPKTPSGWSATEAAFMAMPFEQLNAFTLPAFAGGGEFTVGGHGGTDTSLVQFMATPGEKVTVTHPKDADTANGSITINGPLMVVHANDAESFRRSSGQITADLSVALARARRYL